MSDSDANLRLDRQLCFPLYAASNLLTRRYQPKLSRLGLTYPQYLTLLILWENSPSSVGDLGRRLYLDSGTLTPLLKRLEAAGVIRRWRDPEDERRVLIELTDARRALKRKARDVPTSLMIGLDMSRRELQALRSAVQRLVTALAVGA